MQCGFVWERWARTMERLTFLLFSGFSYDQPIEDIFKRWGRLAKRGRENGKITMCRLFACQRAASLKSYPDVEQIPVGLDSNAWSALDATAKVEITHTANITFAPCTNLKVAENMGHASSVAWPNTKLKPPTTGQPTCSAFEHPHQAAYEFVLSLMEVDRQTFELAWNRWRYCRTRGWRGLCQTYMRVRGLTSRRASYIVVMQSRLGL